MDWRAGAKLQSFEILGEGEAIDANLHCQVKLKFAQPQNGKKEVTVYLSSRHQSRTNGFQRTRPITRLTTLQHIKKINSERVQYGKNTNGYIAVLFTCETNHLRDLVSGAILLSTESVSTADEQSSWKAWERLSDEQAWALLPTLATGEKQPLPNWIKPVVLQMPRTAAAMLELDKAFRDGGPLEPALRAKLRWIIAHANGCGYGRELALADLRRVAGDKVKLSEFAGNPADWPASEADDFEFVRLLTVSGPTIPDELFERLRVKHGDRGVAAMVLLTAYGNFQDRLLLGLNVPIEKNGLILR